MFKTILQSFLGIIFFLSGIYCFYSFITGLNSGANFFFFVLFLLLVGLGIFFFIKAGKSDSTVLSKIPDNKVIDANKNVNFSNRLAENNALLNDWAKTNDTKDRLRLLEVSAKASDE